MTSSNPGCCLFAPPMEDVGKQTLTRTCNQNFAKPGKEIPNMPLLPYRHHQPPATTTAKLFQVSVKKKYCQLPPNTGNANKLPLKSLSVCLSDSRQQMCTFVCLQLQFPCGTRKRHILPNNQDLNNSQEIQVKICHIQVIENVSLGNHNDPPSSSSYRPESFSENRQCIAKSNCILFMNRKTDRQTPIFY